MATDSSHRVIMEKRVMSLFSALFYPFFLYLQIIKICMKARRSSKFGQIGRPTVKLGALERLKINPYILIMGKTVLPVFLSCF